MAGTLYLKGTEHTPFSRSHGIGKNDWKETVLQITWQHAMKVFGADNQHLELHPKKLLTANATHEAKWDTDLTV